MHKIHEVSALRRLGMVNASVAIRSIGPSLLPLSANVLASLIFRL